MILQIEHFNQGGQHIFTHLLIYTPNRAHAYARITHTYSIHMTATHIYAYTLTHVHTDPLTHTHNHIVYIHTYTNEHTHSYILPHTWTYAQSGIISRLHYHSIAKRFETSLKKIYFQASCPLTFDQYSFEMYHIIILAN